MVGVIVLDIKVVMLLVFVVIFSIGMLLVVIVWLNF